jgi:ferredoxin, 2Fe-2S
MPPKSWISSAEKNMPKITFRNEGKSFEVEPGISVLDAALRHNVEIYHTCGGNCSCSTCRVLVISGAEHLSPMQKCEAEILASFDLKAPHRLGCQALVFGDTVEVEVPKREREPRPNKTPKLPGE